MLINMANSITDTSITGRETDFNTIAIIKKIKIMDTALTVLKSWSVIVIKSWVQGASPISIMDSSYPFIILRMASHCSFTSSVPVLYSDIT